MQTQIYSLSQKENYDFYEDLSTFTDKFIATSDEIYKVFIDPYSDYLSKSSPSMRHRDEYLVEFLMCGMFADRYWTFAQKSSSISIRSHRWMFDLRKRLPRFKIQIDQVRGYTSSRWLFVPAKKTDLMNIDGFSKLIQWLYASGEFKEEAQRLGSWTNWLKTCSDQLSKDFIAKARAFSQVFIEKAETVFGKYTDQVNTFLDTHKTTYQGREDYLFCGRKSEEYHLNMFGAEILNRVLAKDFQATTERVLIMPTCMSSPRTECRAVVSGMHLICTGCTSSCNVNVIQRDMEKQNVTVRLIPHSSGFSKFLEQWRDQKLTGLIGVACVLNLLTGGYEMQRLGIPSQCVFLDNCGCKKHWHPQGIPTHLNRQQLLKTVCR